MRRSARSLVSAGVLILAGCKHASDAEIRYKEVPVAVSAGCVVDRPAPVVSLKDRMTEEEWRARAPGAKAATIEGQAYDRMNYADKLDAATKGCRPAK